LFDGESALASKKNKDYIFKNFGIKIYAQPGYKRYAAERAIKGKLCHDLST